MELSDVNLLEDTWWGEVPHEMFDLLREQAPVFWHAEPPEQGPGFWAVTRWEDIRAVSTDTATFSNEEKGTFIKDPDPEALAQYRLSILNMDPPKHHRYRRLVNRGFTPRVIRTLEQTIEERSRMIVDQLESNSDIDFVADVAVQMPAQVICDMLGVPPEDQQMVVDWTNTMVGFDDPYWQNTAEDGMNAAVAMFGYCFELAQQRRAEPRDDIASVLVEAEVDGERLTDEELVMFFVTLAVAGNETTRNLITHSVMALDRFPEVAAELRADPSLWPTAVEEMLRWGSSIHNFRRTAMVDTRIGDVDIAAGDKVVIYYMAGNFDPAVFADPHTFDIRRSANEHQTFGGGGEHYCLGANLAKVEIRAMLREFVDRVDSFQITGDPIRMRSDFINGINKLPMHIGTVAPATSASTSSDAASA